MQCKCGGIFEPFCSSCEVPQWVKYSDGIPPPNIHSGRFLVRYLDGYMCVAFFNTVSNEFEHVIGDDWKLRGTHWMYLPNLPEES